MQAEIITIGDELLIGMTVDTNSAWMGQELTNIGIKVYQVTSISDNREHILEAIDQAMSRSDLVLVTGGLGPTSDDITKETIAEYFDNELVVSDDALRSIKKLISARGLEMNENNRKQALVPAGCEVLPNAKGTAPGMLFHKEDKILVSMPGVPYEMKDIMNTSLIPYLKNNFSKNIITYRLIMIYGTFEAKLSEILEPFENQLPESITLAYLPTAGIIKLRLTGRGSDKSMVDNQLNEQVEKLKSIIPEYIYGFDGELLEECVGKLLLASDKTLSIAESCTGGSISRMIIGVPGSSAYMMGAIVAYNNSIKSNELNVSSELIDKMGAVSKDVAIAMAEGIRRKFASDYSVATTGIAGPDGGTEVKPVGTVWVAVSSKNRSLAMKFNFGNIREHNIRRSSLVALNMLRTLIIKEINS
jgi:nicotinamide-nucleotide amidase